jgi:hypothetical protein
MCNDIYIINHGNAVITPSSHSGLATLTLKFGHHYHKVRDIVVERATKRFNPKEWFSIGRGDAQILLKKDQVERAFASISSFYKHGRVNLAFSNCLGPKAHVESLLDPSADQYTTGSRLFSGFLNRDTLFYPPTRRERKEFFQYLHDHGYKITCIMNPEGALQIVGVRKLGEGKYKYVKKMRSIWESGSYSEFGPIAVIAKGRKNVDPNELLKEVGISKRLVAANVPFIRLIRKIERNDPNKAGLMMEFCDSQTLEEYIRPHFDMSTHTVKQKFRENHISLLKQVAEALYGMQQQNLVHCDLKSMNILLKKTLLRVEARVSDFGGVEQSGTKVHHIPATYPPPELVENVELQRKKTVDRFTLAQKAKFCLFLNDLKKQGFSQGRIEKEKNNYLKDIVKEIPIDSKIDAWALGVLLFEVMHNHPKIIENLSWEHSSSEIKKARDIILQKLLNPNDPVDEIARKLLTGKFDIQKARDYLQEAR